MPPGLFAGTQWDREPHCERCDQPESACHCPPLPSGPAFLPPAKQTARLAKERRAKGKLVTVIRGLAPTESDLPALLTRLKNLCGTGGTLSDGGFELRGDHLEPARQALTQLGYRVKG